MGSALPVLKIDETLAVLGLSIKKRAMTHSTFNTGSVSANFAQIIYLVRNAIVHNKETEFHLNYATLNDTIYSLIELFLMPTLEEICFGLIGKENAHIWYKNRELNLY